MQIKKTVIIEDYARVLFKKRISLITVEDIKDFIRCKEDSVGEKNIDFVKHEFFDNISHKLTVHQADIDPAGDAERTTIYEWRE